MAQDKIMIVDNEMEIIQLIKLYLSREGFNVIWTTDSTEAVALAQKEKPDLILLDVVMPNMNGIDLCSRIRETISTPILFVSCKNQDADKVLGLSIGGDDYITKPFSPTELVARVRAHLRRQNINSMTEAAAGENIMSAGSLEINLSSHTVTVGGEEVHLTAKEFSMLVLFCKYPNRVFTAQQLYENLWNTYGLEVDAQTVMVHISNLREKIEADSNNPTLIKTVRGVGYKLTV